MGSQLVTLAVVCWPRMVIGWAWGARSSASTKVPMRSCCSRLALCRSATRAVVSCW